MVRTKESVRKNVAFVVSNLTIVMNQQRALLTAREDPYVIKVKRCSVT
jgi:hypothetical protein